MQIKAVENNPGHWNADEVFELQEDPETKYIFINCHCGTSNEGKHYLVCDDFYEELTKEEIVLNTEFTVLS